MNRVIAGFDPVLVDAYAAELIGLDSKAIEYITLAEQFGVGSSTWTRQKSSSSEPRSGRKWPP